MPKIIRFSGYGSRPRVHRAALILSEYVLQCNRTESVSRKWAAELKEGDVVKHSEMCGLCFKMSFTLVYVGSVLCPSINRVGLDSLR